MRPSCKRLLFLMCFIADPMLSSSIGTEFNPGQIYALGLTFKKHIEETGEKANPLIPPPVFIKEKRSFLKTKAGELTEVKIPSQESIYKVIEFLDKEIDAELKKKFAIFPLMLDYEAELGLYFKEDFTREDLVSGDYRKKILFFVANDLTLRSLQVLGEGVPNKLDFWSQSKSFEGFLPVGPLFEAPEDFQAYNWPRLTLKTFVNKELRQEETLQDMIYSPKQLLEALLDSQNLAYIPGATAVICGTPSGVAFKTPHWKKVVAEFFGFSRFTKLKFASRAAAKSPLYLKANDRVRVLLGDYVSEVRILD
jgi:2-keto-4-pentenoate hydratase/2-oxohepta-3-ene-1,7-dioic acid hydratase in catechol pathway